ncbi:MAG: thioredoxin domain-containing protein [Planctomycetaceae bacterium]
MKSLSTLLAIVALHAGTTTAQDEKPHDVQSKRSNRLAKESSPYLLMHAHNPVDWYPWGDEAFEKAKKENKPIFLSVGYSSCYWCHVMEREVFENEKIAKYMNEHFVNIKLDREERPDLDEIYMTALQIYNQAIGNPSSGGWPMSMFLMPDGRPFAGGSYFPAESGPRGPGFQVVAEKVIGLYGKDGTRIEQTADQLTTFTRRAMSPKPPTSTVALNAELVDGVRTAIAKQYDIEFGGVNFDPRRPKGPKFAVPPRIEYLLTRSEEDALRMAYLTLDKMLAGGIRDHLAGGFHRYSTDQRWHVPHFEKMLYDQAQLATVYTKAWKLTKKPAYKQAATEILDYVLSDFTDKNGGFYSALDAETNTIEGEYYVWDRATIDKVLGSDSASFCKTYGLNEANPFEHGFVLHLPGDDSVAASLKPETKALRAKLLAERDKREAPFLDDKVLTSWNGLMIRAFAEAGATFESDAYRNAAMKAADFVLTKMTNDEGRLFRTSRKGKASLNGYLDDYAFVISGLLTLHETTSDAKWLDAAKRLQDKQDELFVAKETGGYYFTSNDHEELIVRTRNATDGVLPSGNSVSVRNLVQLATLTDNSEYREQAKQTLDAFAEQMRSNSAGSANMAIGLAEYLAADSSSKSARSRDVLQKTSYVVQVGTPVSQQKKKPTPKKKKPVEARAFLSVDKLPAGNKAKVAIYIRIKENWHINANKPNPAYCFPTTFSVKSKYGTKLVSVKYPAFKKKRQPGEKEPFHILTGTVVVYGLLDIPAAAKGKTEDLQLILSYQSCDDKTNMCLRPDKIVLGGKLPVVDVASVNQINKPKFIALDKKKTDKRRKQ